MKFRIQQFVSYYETYEFEAKDKAEVEAQLKLLNRGRIGVDEMGLNVELVDQQGVDGGDFHLLDWQEGPLV